MALAKVSVILAVYNGEAFLARAIESAFGQLSVATEIIAVDDGSTDGTAGVLRRFGDRIRVITQSNAGLAAARNAGVAASTGEYIAFLDADDVWMAERLAKTVAPLEASSGVVLAYCDLIPVDDLGVRLASGYVADDLAHAPTMDELMEGWWPILPSAVTMRRSTFDECGGFRATFKSAAGFEDTYMWLLARERGEFAYVNEALMMYHLTPFVERMRKYAPGFKEFAKLVRHRYGERGQRLVNRNLEVYVWLLTMRGMRYLRDYDPARARQAMFCAFRYYPTRATLRRALGTLLPRAAAERMIKPTLAEIPVPEKLGWAVWPIRRGAIPVDLR
ncbi:MAG TPA: glycosyltransferase [Candidatus Binataceae bacterium]|nr:glycosyltransferase [Candidatus Binataceae bacterium]